MKVPYFPVGTPGKSFPQDGIPIDADKNFRMWYTFSNIINPDVFPPAYESYSYPRASKLVNATDVPDDNTVLIPAIGNKQATAWADYHLRQPTDAANLCRNDGVSLDRSTVTVQAVVNGMVRTDVTVSNQMDVDNTFSAIPKNGPTVIPAGGLKARFRIANWGSTIGDVFGTEELWRTVVKEATNPNPVMPNMPVTLSGTWTAPKNDDFVAKFFTNPPERTDHQCVLVELSAGGDVFFVNSSVFQNMHVGKASKFSQAAQISVAGLPPVKPDAKTRDVFLYTHTIAMPPAAGVPPPTPWKTTLPKPAARSVPVSPRRRGGGDDGPPKVVPPKDGPPRINLVADRPQPETVPIRVEPPHDPAKPLDPTYVVFAWHDTGSTLRINGLTVRVVESQTSFGYYMSHDGPLYGWKHALTGAEKIGPDFYKVSPATGGSVNVRTEIEAVETGPAGPCCPPVIVAPRYERPRLFRRWR